MHGAQVKRSTGRFTASPAAAGSRCLLVFATSRLQWLDRDRPYPHEYLLAWQRRKAASRQEGLSDWEERSYRAAESALVRQNGWTDRAAVFCDRQAREWG